MKITKVREAFLRNYQGVKFYPFQEEISNAIIKEVINKTGNEVAIEIARQAGKTEAVVETVAFLMLFFYPIRIGIFAPQREQAKTDFDRLKDKLYHCQADFNQMPDESNANTLKLPNGSEAYIFPITETSNPESKTLDLIIIEESQGIYSIRERKMKNAIWPMGKATNASKVYIGTAGYHLCHYYRLINNVKIKKLIFNVDEIIKQKRQAYEETNNPWHLFYERSKTKELESGSLSLDDDAYKTQYLLEWVLGAGQFTTMKHLESLCGDYSRYYGCLPPKKEDVCYAGIDTAKAPDSTVVTVVGTEPKRLLNWLELRGDNYETQFENIVHFLSHYYVRAIAIDSTGQGDFMPDKFEMHTQWRDEYTGLYRVKFSAVSKDIMYKNLKITVDNLLTAIPKIETKEAERFLQQMIDLQLEHKGELLSCHHPDHPDARDDYCDSWALAEYAYMKDTQKPMPSIRSI